MIQFQILKLKHHCHGNGIMFPSFVEYHGDEDIAEPFTIMKTNLISQVSRTIYDTKFTHKDVSCICF